MSAKIIVSDELLEEQGHTRKEYEALSKSAKWAFRNRAQARTIRRNSYLVSTYGITSAEYAAMLKEHNSVCGICKKAEDKVISGKVIELAVDHCHTTGEVRGLLCQRCNTGIAKFDDSPQNLQAAIKYLEKHK